MTSVSKGVGIPVKLLHEAEGHIITVELKTGELFRGELVQAEDNWNVQLKKVQTTGKNGRQGSLQHIFIRGSRVRFIVVPDMLKNAPMFKRIDPKNKKKGRSIPLGVGGIGTGPTGRGRGRGGPPGGGGGGPPGGRR